MDMALSRRGAWVLRAFFIALIAFLYLPILLLLVFSFNDSLMPSFPLSGFTLHWYGDFIHDGELRGALETSAIVAALSSPRRGVSRAAGVDRARAPALPREGGGDGAAAERRW